MNMSGNFCCSPGDVPSQVSSANAATPSELSMEKKCFLGDKVCKVENDLDSDPLIFNGLHFSSVKYESLDPYIKTEMEDQNGYFTDLCMDNIKEEIEYDVKPFFDDHLIETKEEDLHSPPPSPTFHDLVSNSCNTAHCHTNSTHPCATSTDFQPSIPEPTNHSIPVLSKASLELESDSACSLYYTCKLCQSELKTFTAVETHLTEKHHISIKCFCGLQLNEFWMFKSHLQNFHKYQNSERALTRVFINSGIISGHRTLSGLYCVLCDGLPPSLTMLMEHVSQFHGNFCHECSTLFPSSKLLDTHRSKFRHSISRPDQCADLPVKTSKKSKNASSNKNLGSVCPLCSFTDAPMKVEMHMISHYLVDCQSCLNSFVSVRKYTCTENQCFVCRKAKTRTRKKMSLHNVTVTIASQPANIPPCTGKLPSGGKNPRKAVQPTKSKVKPSSEPFPGAQSYQCEKCDRKFYSRRAVNLHMAAIHCKNIVNNSNVNNCCRCGFSSMHKSNTIRHIKYTCKFRSENPDLAGSDRKCTWPRCKFTASDESTMAVHMKSHERVIDTTRTVFQCTNCSFTTTRKSALLIHMRRHDDNPYICKICRATFPSPRILKKHHREIHVTSTLFHCEHCEYVTSRKETIKVHMVKKHFCELLIHCKLCRFVGMNQIELHRHIRTHHDPKKHKDIGFSCTHCHRVYKYQSVLMRHVSIAHCGKRGNASLNKNMSCNFCPFKTKHKATISQHIKNYHLTEHNCTTCGQVFSDPKTLKQHSKSEHWVLMFCDACDYKSTDKYLISQHMRKMHLRLNQLYCKECPYSTAVSTNLYRHIHKRHKRKTYVCPHCKAVTLTIRSLWRHIRFNHKGRCDFSCHVCGARFSSKGKLTPHLHKCLASRDLLKSETKL